MTARRFSICCSAIAAFAFACTKEKAEPQANEESAEEHEALPSSVELPAEVVSAAQIRWAPAQRDALDVIVELPGEISADPDRTARVASTVEGRIERINFREGSVVEHGAILAVLRVLDLPGRRAGLAAASARAKAARANVERLEVLAKRGLASDQELQTARAEAEALESESTAASEQLSALGSKRDAPPSSLLELVAPIGGTVVERRAVIGERADPEHPLATIVDLSKVWFLGRVFERDLASVHIGARAEVELSAHPGARFEGTVEYIAQQIDPSARTVVARVVLANRDELLRLGLFGTARVELGKKREAPAIIVPQSAVTDVANETVVFVHAANGRFERRTVVLGTSALGKVEVMSGLREGEEVVTEGVFTLKSAVLKKTFGEEEE